MKKRLFSALICLCMVLALLFQTASAASYTAVYSGKPYGPLTL